jgi:hypothetical protein
LNFITFEYGGEEFTLIVEEDDWTLIDPEGEEAVLVQDGTVMNPFAAGFLSGFNLPATISLGGFGSQVGPFQKYQDAQNYALILGMSKDEAEDWAKGYLIGYSLGEYLSRFKNKPYMRIAKHCFKEEVWNNSYEYIFWAMVSGYPIVLPIPVPWWVELGLYARQIYDIFKNAWN